MHRLCLCVDMHESSQICILNLCLKAWHKGTELCGLWLHCFACFHLNHLFLQTTTGAVSFDAVFAELFNSKFCNYMLFYFILCINDRQISASFEAHLSLGYKTIQAHNIVLFTWSAVLGPETLYIDSALLLTPIDINPNNLIQSYRLLLIHFKISI